MERRLFRSRKDRVISGVCGGLAVYLNQDPTLVRLVFAVLAVASAGFAVAGYLLLWVIVPEEGAQALSPGPPAEPAQSTEEEGAPPSGDVALASPDGDAGAPVDEAEKPAPVVRLRWRDAHLLGWILLAVGVYLLLDALGIRVLTRSLWPLILIVVGVMLLWPHFRRG
jgi:phage shock protein C